MSGQPSFAHADSLSHLLWDVAARTQSLAEKAVSGTPLTLSSIGLLDQIAGQPGVTISQIARRTPKTSQAVSQIAARLEKLGLLERRLIDGRRIGLFLTDAGTAAHDQGTTAQRAFETRLHTAIGNKNAEQLQRLLTRIAPTVARLETEQHPG